FALLALGLTYVSLAPLGTTPPAETLQRIVGPTLAMLLLLIGGGVLAGPPGWGKLGRALGARLDPSAPARCQGTVGVLLLSALAIAPLALLGGRAPLIELLSGFEGSMQTLSNLEQLLLQIYAVIWIGVLVLCCAAWPTWVSVRGALVRLGV